jgi:hypothetical protein
MLFTQVLHYPPRHLHNAIESPQALVDDDTGDDGDSDDSADDGDEDDDRYNIILCECPDSYARSA